MMNSVNVAEEKPESGLTSLCWSLQSPKTLIELVDELAEVDLYSNTSGHSYTWQ